ncbi:hypothetical protein EG68_11313 [Paragonimus skrjabini miyazakii]|uniref:Uncharacterized protein n=1 Tax=Paragonimus skrjabini miyazakii TaxID=59628 RepID=A0A8S9YEW9_9TREM|nr:hypothetical protein EG68_11313 [Paragonimus skrjabini miyazakii]
MNCELKGPPPVKGKLIPLKWSTTLEFFTNVYTRDISMNDVNIPTRADFGGQRNIRLNHAIVRKYEDFYQLLKECYRCLEPNSTATLDKCYFFLVVCRSH